MPPAALTSSTRMRMPFTAALEKLTIGPDRSCAVPITISVGVTPCCASAGVAAISASVAIRYFIVCSPDNLVFAAILKRWMKGTRRPKAAIGFLAHDLIRKPVPTFRGHASSGRLPGIHRLDQVAIFLVHQL